MLFPCSQNMTHSLGRKLANQTLVRRAISWYFWNGTMQLHNDFWGSWENNSIKSFHLHFSNCDFCPLGATEEDFVETQICGGWRSRDRSSFPTDCKHWIYLTLHQVVMHDDRGALTLKGICQNNASNEGVVLSDEPAENHHVELHTYGAL